MHERPLSHRDSSRLVLLPLLSLLSLLAVACGPSSASGNGETIIGSAGGRTGVSSAPVTQKTGQVTPSTQKPSGTTATSLRPTPGGTVSSGPSINVHNSQNGETFDLKLGDSITASLSGYTCRQWTIPSASESSPTLTLISGSETKGGGVKATFRAAGEGWARITSTNQWTCSPPPNDVPSDVPGDFWVNVMVSA